MFPTTIPVKELVITGPEFREDKIRLHQALYDGGEAMDKVKAEILPVREYELMSGGKVSKSFISRLDRAPYSRATAGFIDWLVAACFHNPPRIEIMGDLSEESRQFYSDLMEDSDGRGTPLSQLMRDTVLEGLLHQRCFPMVSFPASEIDVSAPETMAGKFRLLRQAEVGDWTKGISGCELRTVRWHGVEYVRDPQAPWKQAEKLRHVWVFITDKEIVVYEAFSKVDYVANNYTCYNFISEDGGEPVARRVSVGTSGGQIPVVMMEYRAGQWLMETCFDVATALFIRDSSIEFLGDKFAFQILALNLDRQDVGDMFLPDLSALHLRPGESASFIAPQGSVLQPLFQSAEKLRKDLLASIHASAQNAASIPQAGRLSGEAVSEMREPLEVLLEAFSWPVVDAWNKVLRKLIAYRGDPEGCAKIVGMDKFKAKEEELEEVVNGRVGRKEKDDEERADFGAGDSVQPGRKDGDLDSI